MIRRLDMALNKQGLPTTVSKGQNKSAHAQRSKYVAFVAELQNTFPVALRRHASSDPALAQAITLARRNKRDVQKGGG